MSLKTLHRAMEIVQQDSSLHGCVSTELRKTEVSSLVIGKYNPSAQAKWCDEFIEILNVPTFWVLPQYCRRNILSKSCGAKTSRTCVSR